MRRDEYLELPEVEEFIEYVSVFLSDVSLKLTYKKLGRVLTFSGVRECIAHYDWPGEFNAPIGAMPWKVGEPIKTRYLAETIFALDAIGNALNCAVKNESDEAIWSCCEAIWEWGMPKRTIPKLRKQIKQNCEEQPLHSWLRSFLRVTEPSEVDIKEIDSLKKLLPATVGSGLAKVFSLASDGNLVILDSRVAAALGECVSKFLNERGYRNIPESLRFFYDGTRKTRIPTPVGEANQPSVIRDYRFVITQIKASWLMRAIADRNPEWFPDECKRPEQRTHYLEAGFFMIGYDLSQW